MKVGEKNVYINWLYYVRAGELLDVVNILTSPDLLRTVGLPAWRLGLEYFTANQEG